MNLLDTPLLRAAKEEKEREDARKRLGMRYKLDRTFGEKNANQFEVTGPYSAQIVGTEYFLAVGNDGSFRLCDRELKYLSFLPINSLIDLWEIAERVAK